jgi:hypothetical protein
MGLAPRPECGDGGLRDRRNTPGQAGKRAGAGLDAVKRGAHDVGGVVLLDIPACHHVGVDGAHVQRGDQGALDREFQADAVDQGPFGRLRRGIGVGPVVGEL